MGKNYSKPIQAFTSGIFILIVYTYFYYKIDPRLIDFEQQPLFLFDRYFFLGFLKYPGGISEYISLFFTQFFTFKSGGSILLTALIFMSALVTKIVFSFFFSKSSNFFLHYLPALLLLHQFTNYSFQLTVLVIYCLSLACSLLYLLTCKKSFAIRIASTFLLLPLLFFISGGTGILLYSSIVFITEILKFKRKDSIIIIAVVTFLLAGIPYVTSFISAYTGFEKALLGILYFNDAPKPELFLFFGLTPLIIASQPVLKLIGNHSLYRKKLNISFWVQSTTIVTLSLCLSIFTGNKTEKGSILIKYYAGQQQWEKVLKTAKSLPLSDREVIFQVNRALYHEGQLAEEAFHYPQYWGELGLILTTHYTSKLLIYCSDLFFEMGHVKGALHWAYEAQTKHENSPEVLKRIVLCNILSGEYATADKFLNTLSKSVIHKKWASRYKTYLYNINKIYEDKTLYPIFKLMPKNDFFSNTRHPQYDLLKLLEEHPENKMAYEYLMISSLLNHDLANVAVSLKYLEVLGYKYIPKHIEEGLLLFMVLNNNYKPNLGNYQIRKETYESFTEYSKIMAKYKRNKKAAEKEVGAKYGDTFWYYINYISPITTKRINYEE